VFTSDLMKSALIKYAVFWCGKSNDNIWGRSWKIALGDSNQWGWSHDQDAHGNFSIQETIDLPTSDGVFLQFFLEPFWEHVTFCRLQRLGLGWVLETPRWLSNRPNTWKLVDGFFTWPAQEFSSQFEKQHDQQ
jgi:hypothetical protein